MVISRIMVSTGFNRERGRSDSVHADLKNARAYAVGYAFGYRNIAVVCGGKRHACHARPARCRDRPVMEWSDPTPASPANETGKSRLALPRFLGRPPLVLTPEQHDDSSSVRVPQMLISPSVQAPHESPHVKIFTSVDGTIVRQNDVVVISWESVESPPGSRIGLLVRNELSGNIRPVVDSLPVKGDFVWQVPSSAPLPIPCSPSPYLGRCGTILPPGTYRIIARLYVPRDTDGFSWPSDAHPGRLTDGESGAFTKVD